MVFQKLSQHVAWMIQDEPDVALDSLVVGPFPLTASLSIHIFLILHIQSLFGSYESLFVSTCTVCHRTLSEEGHFPPVCRLWTPLRRIRDTSAQEKESGIPADDSEGMWEPRHRTCLGV